MRKYFVPVFVALLTSACEGQGLPTAPTAVDNATAPVSGPTSQVRPEALPEGLTLEHDPYAPGVSVCRTQPRGYDVTYDDVKGPVTVWEIDYYTVVAPVKCPAEPIQ